MENILITISRQFGCGGAYIGTRIAKRLGYVYVDREVLQQAARNLGVEESDLADREERVSSFWESLFRVFMTESVYVPPPIRPIYDRDLFNAEANIINEAADRKSAVIVGRAGFHVLKGRAGLANVFIHASMDFRIRRVMEVYKKDAEEARSLVEESDRDRGKFIHTMTGVEWADARNYHLCIDISRTDFQTAEEMIIMLVESMKRKLIS